MPQIVILDWDDISIATPEIKLLRNIKEHFPKFRCSLFVVPMHSWLLEDEKRFEQYIDWMAALKDMEWLEICPHGFFHDKTEMMTTYDKAKAVILSTEKSFTKFKVRRQRKIFGKKWIYYEPNIKFSKIFKAPGWQMSKEAYEALRDMGYTVAIDRNQPDPNIKGLKTYKFNWSVEEPYPKEFKVVKGHGHIIGMANSLVLNYNKLLNDLPTDSEFMTIGEYLKWKKEND